ncbi:hypothetical protein PSTG_15133 [Puccinia striiformis f. sp. tritici PST-78]|uniref:Zinc finger RING-H2-type domain-containing protein n=1 Tax=Puccinia striiformis f. sp. tritici PST-78 TaxID=1165861 RepID=A0A0L0UWL2_9BASI|nr:hypothetical protein PSTG_15133 [Puccinia striiformis f. sp. tritici PST-78]
MTQSSSALACHQTSNSHPRLTINVPSIPGDVTDCATVAVLVSAFGADQYAAEDAELESIVIDGQPVGELRGGTSNGILKSESNSHAWGTFQGGGHPQDSLSRSRRISMENTQGKPRQIRPLEECAICLQRFAADDPKPGNNPQSGDDPGSEDGPQSENDPGSGNDPRSENPQPGHHPQSRAKPQSLDHPQSKENPQSEHSQQSRDPGKASQSKSLTTTPGSSDPKEPEGTLIYAWKGCDHIFHRKCIQPWLDRHNESCPRFFMGCHKHLVFAVCIRLPDDPA